MGCIKSNERWDNEEEKQKIDQEKKGGTKTSKVEIQQEMNQMKREQEQGKKLRNLRKDNDRKQRWINEGERQKKEREA